MRQCVDYLVARYGEFILLKPRFNLHTALLWMMPPAVLFIGGRRRRSRFCGGGRRRCRPLPLDARRKGAAGRAFGEAGLSARGSADITEV